MCEPIKVCVCEIVCVILGYLSRRHFSAAGAKLKTTSQIRKSNSEFNRLSPVAGRDYSGEEL